MPNASVKPTKSKVVSLHKKKDKKKKKHHAQQPTAGPASMPLTEETKQLLSLVPGHKMTGKVVVKEQPVVRTPSTKPPFHTQAIKKDVVQPALSPYSFSPEKYEYKPPPEPEAPPKKLNPYAKLALQSAHLASYAIAFPFKNYLVDLSSQGALNLNQKILGETLLKKFNPNKDQYKTDIAARNQQKKALELMQQDYARWKRDKNFPYRKEGLEPGAPNELVPFDEYVQKIRTGEWKRPEMYSSAGERMLLDAEKKMHEWRYKQYAPTLPELKEEFKEGVIPDTAKRAADTVKKTYGDITLSHRKDYKDIIDAYRTLRSTSNRVDNLNNLPESDPSVNLKKLREHLYKNIKKEGDTNIHIKSNDKFMDYLEKHSKENFPHSWSGIGPLPPEEAAAVDAARQREDAAFAQYAEMSRRQNELKPEKAQEQVAGVTRGLTANEHENFTDDELHAKAQAFGLDFPPNASHDDLRETFRKYKEEWDASGPAYLKVASPTFQKFQEYHAQLENPDTNVEGRRQILQNIMSHNIDPTDPYHVEAKSYQEKAAAEIKNFNEKFRKSMEPVEYLPQNQKDIWTAVGDIEGLPQQLSTKAKIGFIRALPAIGDVVASAATPFLLEWGFNEAEKQLGGQESPSPNIPLWIQQSMLQHVVPTGYQFNRSAAV